MGCLGNFTLPCEDEQGSRIHKVTCSPVSNSLSGNINFIDPNVNTSAICILNDILEEQIALYGTDIQYQIYDYSLTGHSAIYGEMPNAKYLDPIDMRMLIKFTNDTISIGGFGFVSNAQINAIISIKQFETYTGSSIKEPKSEDLIILKSIGSTRKHGRGSMVFKITQRVDEGLDSLLGINPLLSHSVWYITAVRHEFTSQPNNTPELLDDQIYDSLSSGNITFTSEDPNDTGNPLLAALKKYSKTADEISKENFDQETYDVDTNVYGNY